MKAYNKRELYNEEQLKQLKEWHYELWNELYRNPLLDKSMIFEKIINRVNLFGVVGKSAFLWMVANHCFLCAKLCNTDCVLFKANRGCRKDGSWYQMWCNAETTTERKKYAKLIWDVVKL